MKGFGRREEPVEMCGGTTSSYDKKAPKRIKSGEMIFFSATSALGYREVTPDGREPIAYVSAFAAPAAEGTFLYLSTGDSFRRRDGKSETWALVKEDVFPSLVALVREHDLAKNNGYHSTTHGLPENFGGDVDIRYASGERISFSNNQTPVLSLRCGEAIADLFGKAMSGERIALPDAEELTAIEYEEKRDNGGFEIATLTLNPDGTATNEKRSRYDDPTVYESVNPVDAETVAAIKNNIADTALLAWPGLPENGYSFGRKRSMTFLFRDGRSISVTDDKIVPGSLSRGFFNVQLEMTTKH